MNEQNMKPNSIVWFEIYVDEMKRAKAFYETVLNCKLLPLGNEGSESQGMEMWAFPGDMQNYGANGAICKMPGFSAGRNSTLIYFGSEDCALEESRVLKAGGRIEKSKQSIGPHGFISLVYDSEGNMIGFHSMN